MIKYPDYSNCIVNLVNSAAAFVGAEALNPTLPQADKIIRESGCRNVIVFILDGLGKYNIETSLKPNSFLRRHMIGSISSVFPPTTVASTTAADSGLYPSEHCRLGWSLYFEEVDKNVNVFLNTDYEGNPAADYNVPNSFVPYTSLVERVKQAGGKADSVSNFGTVPTKDFEDICEQIKRLCAEEGKHYLYAYWHEPDSTMHLKGVLSEEVKAVSENLSAELEKLCRELHDTVVFVTADHGHIDSHNKFIGDYPDIVETLKEYPSVEPRALAFRVKEGMDEKFVKAFREHFSEDDFILMTGEEVRAKKLFGPVENDKLKKYTGDYFAVAVGDISLFYSKQDYQLCIGVHAGLTEREMDIPFTPIVCPCRD